MKNDSFIRYSNFHYKDLGGHRDGRLIFFMDPKGYLYAFDDDARLVSRVFGVRPSIVKMDDGELICMFKFKFGVTPYARSCGDSLYRKVLDIVGPRGKIHTIEYMYQEAST